MTCRYCGTNVKDGTSFCPQCGARMEDRQQAAAAASTGLMLSAAARKRARLTAVYSEDQLIDVRLYNVIMAGVVLWGLLVNVALCTFAGDVYEYVNPLVFLIGYFVCAFLGIFIAAKSSRPWISFLGYNLVVVPFGLMISTVVAAYGGVDSEYVAAAFLYTTLITIGMTATALLFPQLFARLGGALLGVLVGLILCEVVLLIMGVDQVVTDWIAAGLFSLYIGYDVYRSQQFPKTVDNAVDSALDIYLDIANLFLRLLQIFGRRRR